MLTLAPAGLSFVLCAQAPQDPMGRPDAERQPMPLPAVSACDRDNRTIDIDGSLAEWPQLPVIDLADLRQLSGTANGAWREPADCSAYAFVMWDADYLWFAATVKDEWHRPLAKEAFTLLETPIADSIVLTIDPRRDTRALGADPGRREDVELWLGEEASHEVLQWDRLRGTARLLADESEPDESRLVVSHDKERSITTYEMRVRWRSLLPPGQQAQRGRAFDLQIVVNDFDEGTDPMPQTRIGWTFGCSVIADPGLLGTVILTDADSRIDGVLPEVPARPEIEVPQHLRAGFWQEFLQQLRALPATVHDGRRAPEEAGGIGRFVLLEQLDAEIARVPRLDFLEFCQRSQRQMAREVTGIEMTGIPSFWDQTARHVAKEAAEPALPGTLRLHRLPQNGWLVRGEKLAFLVDPAAARAASLFAGLSDFVLLTEPLDLARRSDPLLLRLCEARPPRLFHAHIAFHLPLLPMQDMPLLAPGDERLEANGSKLVALGEKRADGKVSFAMGYQVRAAGITLVFAGASLRAQDVPASARNCHCLVLTARNPDALELAAALTPQLCLVDGGFACFQEPHTDRVSLRMLHALQKLLLPSRSLLLAPGESWEVSRSD